MAGDIIAYQLRSRKILKPKTRYSHGHQKRSKQSCGVIINKDRFLDLDRCVTTDEDLGPKLIVSESLCRAPRVITMIHLSHREITVQNMDMYTGLARKALAYYNAEKRTNLLFKDVTVGAMRSGRLSKVHINFVASSDDDSHLLFAELVRDNGWKRKSHGSGEFHVKGCCLLQKIDSGNPLGRGCSLCCCEVIHPGPIDGYRIVEGDAFRGCDFWKYIFQPSNPKPIQTYKDMYVACAQKALEYYNAKQI